ncbi:MAG: helix-turn-helix domain-containing protein [Pirellulales bacterium]
MTEKTQKRRGRPTKYKPEFCDAVIELGEQGKSRTQIARSLGVVRQTLTDWEASHPDFSDAMSIAEEYAQAWWEDRGQEGILLGKQFNGFVYSFQMKNRFRKEYAEKLDLKHEAGDSFKALWAALPNARVAA